MQASATLGEIAGQLGGELIGDPATGIDAVGPLESATPSTIAFLANPLYEKQLASSRAGCVIVAPAFKDAALARGAAIVTPDPYLYFARLTQWWAERTRPRPVPGVHPSALVDPAAEVAADASIGAVRRGRGRRRGRRRRRDRRACLRRPRLPARRRHPARPARDPDVRDDPRRALLRPVRRGHRCRRLRLRPTAGRWEKIEQLGRVRIGDDVEIGANSCIDRGAAGDTVIDDGVKIDNLVQIGHNVRIGAHTAIAGCVGIAGSATIGAHCMIGGGVGINGHVSIADRVVITGATQVTRSIAKAGVYSGAVPVRRQCLMGEERSHAAQSARLARTGAGAGEEAVMTLDIHQILKQLPHRYPFLMVDRVIELEHGKRIKAVKNVSANEPYFLGHFPRRPVMPGVMMIEALAQAAALLSFDAVGASPDETRSTISPASMPPASSVRSSRATSWSSTSPSTA